MSPSDKNPEQSSEAPYRLLTAAEAARWKAKSDAAEAKIRAEGNPAMLHFLEQQADPDPDVELLSKANSQARQAE